MRVYKIIKRKWFLSIVITKKDKDGEVVVINKTNYYNVLVKILQDKVIYKKPNGNCGKKYFKDLESFVGKFINYLLIEKQVHKSIYFQKTIQVWKSDYIKIYLLSDLTLRPVVTGPECPTRCLLNLVDILSKSFLISYQELF